MFASWGHSIRANLQGCDSQLLGITLLKEQMTRASDRHTESTSRIAPRYQFETRVAIQMKNGTTTEGWVRDLSESGIGAFVGRELTVGEMGTLTFRLTDAIKIVVPAQVVVSVGTRYGFRFLALSAEQRGQILKATQHLKVIPFVGAS